MQPTGLHLLLNVKLHLMRMQHITTDDPCSWFSAAIQTLLCISPLSHDDHYMRSYTLQRQHLEKVYVFGGSGF